MEWINAKERLPAPREWVLCLCKLKSDILKNHHPIMFEAQHVRGRGWFDWCGDSEGDDFEVLYWRPKNNLEIPECLDQ